MNVNLAFRGRLLSVVMVMDGDGDGDGDYILIWKQRPIISEQTKGRGGLVLGQKGKGRDCDRLIEFCTG